MSNTTANPSSRTTDEVAGKYLTFTLAGEDYGLPALKVREIIRIMDITAVPQVPSYVRGVINLRGKVIPVIDLRHKLGFETRDYDERTCIVVVEVALSSTKTLMGVVVDTVSEVLNILPEEIEPTPEFGGRIDTRDVRAMAKIKNKVKILLDVDRILGAEQFGY
jgi:purine-binding chemotaxis protein CheW